MGVNFKEKTYGSQLLVSLLLVPLDANAGSLEDFILVHKLKWCIIRRMMDRSVF